MVLCTFLDAALGFDIVSYFYYW